MNKHLVGAAVCCFAAVIVAAGQRSGTSTKDPVLEGALPSIDFDLISLREPRNPGDPPERVREARVSLGGPAVQQLPGMADLNRGRSATQHYLLAFQITLHEPREGRHYQWVEVHFEFPDEHFRILDLFPLKTNGGPSQIEALSVNRDLRLVPGRLQSCLASAGVRFPPQQTAQGFGLGENSVYWRFSAEADTAVSSGTREGFLLLQAPVGLQAIESTVWTSAAVGRLTKIGWWFFREAKSNSFKARWPVP